MVHNIRVGSVSHINRILKGVHNYSVKNYMFLDRQIIKSR